MAYRRRRSYSCTNRRRRRNEGGAGGLFIAIVVIIGIILVIVLTPMGEWINDNVFSPLFGTTTPSPSPTMPDMPEVTDAATVSEEITLDAMDFYMLQMGVFTSQENAASYAESLKKQGGAGDVYEQDGRFRVIAYAYSTQEDANTVKQRLVDSGYECAIFALPIHGATYRITATNDQINSLTSSLSALKMAMEAVSEVALTFDSEKLTIEEGKERVQTIYDSLDSALLTFSPGGSTLLLSVDEYCTTYKDALNNILVSNFTETIDFSSLLKYTQVMLTCEYANLIDSLA